MLAQLLNPSAVVGPYTPETIEAASLLRRARIQVFDSRTPLSDIPHKPGRLWVNVLPKKGGRNEVTANYGRIFQTSFTGGGSDFWKTSVLFDVISWIAQSGSFDRLPGDWVTRSFPEESSNRGDFFLIHDVWYVCVGDDIWKALPTYLVAAAADRFRAEAYRDRCPGISGKQFYEWRLRQLTWAMRKKFAQVEDLMRRAKALLWEAETLHLEDAVGLTHDMRSVPDLLSPVLLTELALREQVTILAYAVMDNRPLLGFYGAGEGTSWGSEPFGVFSTWAKRQGLPAAECNPRDNQAFVLLPELPGTVAASDEEVGGVPAPVLSVEASVAEPAIDTTEVQEPTSG